MVSRILIAAMMAHIAWAEDLRSSDFNKMISDTNKESETLTEQMYKGEAEKDASKKAKTEEDEVVDYINYELRKRESSVANDVQLKPVDRRYNSVEESGAHDGRANPLLSLDEN